MMVFINKSRNCIRLKLYVLKLLFTKNFYFFLLLFILGSLQVAAQNPAPPPASPDTVRIIQIIQGNSLREKTIDSITKLRTIAGNVILREGLTLFYCDSATINSRTNVLEAFGNVHINQNDSVDTYSQYLRYVGTERMAYLKKDVKLTDKKGILYTQELQYDLKSSIGTYTTGGRVVNGTTVLTSQEGVYYGSTKDVYFKKNVHLVDPKYDIVSDSLLYNTQSQMTTFITATKIKSKNGGDIYTTNGTYNLRTGQAYFGQRSVIKDSTRTYLAENMAFDEKSGIAQLEGNAIIKDSVNGYTVIGGQIFSNKFTGSFLATRKPVLIFKGDAKDSTFIAADTLFSAVEKIDSNGNRMIIKDTLRNTTTIDFTDTTSMAQLKKSAGQKETPIAFDWAKPIAPEKKHDSSIVYVLRPIVPDNVIDTSAEGRLTKRADAAIAKIRNNEAVKNRLPIDPELLRSAQFRTPPDSLFIGLAKKDTAHTKLISKADSIKKVTAPKMLKDTSIRYFQAFHHVRIFNDSAQAVCDSLFYSSEDSVFRLYQKPLLFNNKSQVAGDTIYLFTLNKKARRMYVFENSIMINEANALMYNQMGGRTINAYFKDGNIDYMRVKGSPAESVFYPQDNDSAYIGMDRNKGDLIDIYFLNKEVHRIKYVNDIDGTLFPMRQRPEDQKFLKNFHWWESRRPKNKFELFE